GSGSSIRSSGGPRAATVRASAWPSPAAWSKRTAVASGWPMPIPARGWCSRCRWRVTMANKARVLVVDDEAQIRRALRVALRANGYDVEEAETGEEALDAVATRPPDLVILDLGLPDLDGVEVCRRLREWSRLPIIVLSAHGDD